MNSIHDAKDWHISQAPLQSPSVAETPTTPQPHMQHYSPMPAMDHAYGHPFSQGPMHPPVHQQPPSTASFLPPSKPDSDPRLPGMMTLSQPGTPRPTLSPTDGNRKGHLAYSTSSFHAAPYPHPSLTRKRGRNDPLFSSELGPFFSSTKPTDNLFALDRSSLLNVRIHAKMDRGFFLADNDWTCYRRNYFQVSTAFSIHGLNNYYGDHESQCLVQVDGMFHPVRQFLISISARVSNSDKRIELVQHTPKRDKGPQCTPTPRPITPGGNLSMSSVGTNQNIVTFERIQFKTATANNGKRRAAQQYYVCLVDLYADYGDNKQVKVASCQSAPLVVRGRSPGHYSDNQDRYDPSMTMANAAPASQPADDRFAAQFPRPPMTPPNMMPGGEYGSPYPYQYNYPHFAPVHTPLQPMMMTNAPPTPTAAAPPPPPQHLPATSTPYSHPSHPYMVPSMSDPSSSESSSPDLYTNEYNTTIHTPDDSKLGHPQLPHPQHPSSTALNLHMPMDDWTRQQQQQQHHHHHQAQPPSHHQSQPAARYSQHPAQSPAYEHPGYFTPTSTSVSGAPPTTAYSTTSPVTPYGPRKYNAVPNIVNQPSS
ncbi:uncharacterized protein BYT42DRAFT_582065 [Radiomyces spectabilis]|uniref:uncharacterized protein n=1 Tax=Radiomyces spectabilis TaxID=64574 RepID=UPI00221F43D0|nr:uncharacterized protein BYT42DRAFT_582065 [Radiomyces spectabilis]KAI8370363.1 hypothetical protein BYT42DRAFT_582065 [Radiomyces spectabilis]